MELNREDVVKALTCCAVFEDCAGCPYYSGVALGCTSKIMREALSLIEELTEERERCLEALSELADNIGLLKDKARADAVRKMQEMLECSAYTPKPYGTCKVVDVYEIHQIAKEMLKENV